MRLVHWIAALAFFTASFDIVLVFRLGGTVRFAQLMLILLIVAGIAQIVQSRTILWSRGASALALWCLLQALLISQSLTPALSLQLYLLLLFTILGLFGMLQLYGRSRMLEPLMKIYLQSFVFVSICGLIQFVTPSLHLGVYYVSQWVRHGLIPRVSGFSYEPSYYATYLIVGWISLVDLRFSRSRIVSGRAWTWAIVLVACALAFSTSKTGVIVVVADLFVRLAGYAATHLRSQLARLRTGSLVVPLPDRRSLARFFSVALATLGILVVFNSVISLDFLLSGTGIGNNAAHSVLTRQHQYEDTLEVFRQHPWIGRSLGGVPADVAALHGEHVTTVDELRLFWGFPVPLDVLAASGILGIIPFAWFFLVITLGERSLIRQTWPDERAKWLRALIRALIFEWLALLADQNLIRVYFWFHVTMVVIVGYHLRYSRTRSFSASIAEHAPSLTPVTLPVTARLGVSQLTSS